LNQLFKDGFNPDWVLDIGAYDGIWTKSVLTHFTNSSFFLVDPLPQNKAHLDTLERENANIKKWMGAVGEKIGKLELNVHEDQSSFYEAKEYLGKRLDVEVRPLDDLATEFGFNKGRVFLKADIQGAELDMLKGAEIVIAQSDAILLELTIRRIYQRTALADEVIAFLSARGFGIYDICTYSQRPKDNLLCQTDILFVRKSTGLLGAIGWD